MALKYKIGNKVRIKSIDWYNKNKDNCGCVYAGNGFGFWKDMTKHCGKIMKIASVKIDPEDSNKGYYFMENNKDKWTDEMIEGLVEDEPICLEEYIIEKKKIIDRANKAVTDAFNNGSEFERKRLIEKACKIYRMHIIKFNPILKEFPTALDEGVNMFRKQLEE